MSSNMSYMQSEGIVPSGISSAKYLEQAVKLSGDTIALIDDHVELTYHQLYDSVNNLSAALLRFGIHKGDKIAILMPNCVEFVVVSQAILNIGVVKVPLHINFREIEILTALHHSEAKAIIMASEYGGFSFVELIDRLRPKLPKMEYVIVKGQSKLDAIPLEQLLFNPTDAKTIVSTYLDDNPVDPDETGAIIYTSGTTGTPKGVLHSQNNLFKLAYSSNFMREVIADEVFFGMLPLSSAFGVQYIELCPIISRTTLLLLEKFDPEIALKLIDRYQVTSPVGVPTMFIRMLKHPNFQKYNVSSVRNAYLGGAAAPVDMMRDIKEKFGCTITMTYGASEFGHATMTQLKDSLDTICTTSGVPIYGGREVKIADINGNILPRNSIGEIYVKGFGTTQGYFKDPERTKNLVQNGWYHVNDLGIMNDEGYISVVGRSKDMIVRGGNNIYPDEIESLLYRHPKIAEVSIVGYPDKDLGERTCAYIVPKNGISTISRDELADFLSEKVAKYKFPDMVRIVPSFPLTATGKVQKNKLGKMLLNEI
ncbi:MAG: class I adenylate-forming enzyme family protein [Desulfatirhabdiaceae bacterium]